MDQSSALAVDIIATSASQYISTPWWRHQMETFSALLAICAGNSPVNFPHKGQWRGAFMFPLICVWINRWVNNCEAGDLRRYRAHYDVIVMRCWVPVTDLPQSHDELTPWWGKFVTKNHIFKNAAENLCGVFLLITVSNLVSKNMIDKNGFKYLVSNNSNYIVFRDSSPRNDLLYWLNYIDVIMTTMASQITGLTVVYSTVYSDADQRKHQSSVSLAFVWGIHRHRWIPRTKGQLRGKCFHLMTSSCKRFNQWLGIKLAQSQW